MDIQIIKNRFGIIGNSPELNYALEVAVQVANTDLTVLIMGESGVGKEVFSQIIHTLSARKHNPFIAAPSPKEQLIQNYSVMKKDLSPVRQTAVKVISKRLTAVPFFWMRSGNCP
jgi:KaiC/GvpD/RAD55 family RecA-like ATPase